MERLTSMRRGERQSEQELLSVEITRSHSARTSPSIVISDYISLENRDDLDYQVANTSASAGIPSPQGDRLRRFYIRTLISVFFPLFMTVYFIVIWRYFLITDTTNGKYIGHRGTLVFYSWFIISTVAWNLGKYGTAGTEAGLLMDRFWAPTRAAQMMHHGDHSWSGPSGWLHLLRVLAVRGVTAVGLRKNRQTPSWPSRAWFILSAMSLLPFIAIPLSGLTMELATGYHVSGLHANVTGRQRDDFNQRFYSEPVFRAIDYWESAAEPRLPKFGIVYTNDTDSRNTKNLESVPNSLPIENGTGVIFLPPQGDYPMSGNMWGVALRYDCAIATEDSDFTFLTQRNQESINATLSRQKDGPSEHRFRWGFSTSAGNVQMLFIVAANYSRDAARGYTDDYPGLEADQILEVQLWQYFNATDNTSPDETIAVTHPIQGIPAPSYANRVYNQSRTERENPIGSDYNGNLTDNPIGIGVRCISSSAVGTADIDARKASFTNFQRNDTIKDEAHPEYLVAYRFSHGIPGSTWRSTDHPESDVAYDMLASAGVPPNWTISKGNGERVISEAHLQAEDLRRSMLRAHAAYALQLMYDPGNSSWSNDDVTMWAGKSVLTAGKVPRVLVAILLSLWTILSASFALTHGLRRRWADTLGARSMFAFGADHAKYVEDGAGVVSTLGSEQAEDTLQGIPGMVGDSKPGPSTGHITFVRKTSEADKEKLYY